MVEPRDPGRLRGGGVDRAGPRPVGVEVGRLAAKVRAGAGGEDLEREEGVGARGQVPGRVQEHGGEEAQLGQSSARVEVTSSRP